MKVTIRQVTRILCLIISQALGICKYLINHCTSCTYKDCLWQGSVNAQMLHPDLLAMGNSLFPHHAARALPAGASLSAPAGNHILADSGGGGKDSNFWGLPSRGKLEQVDSSKAGPSKEGGNLLEGRQTVLGLSGTEGNGYPGAEAAQRYSIHHCLTSRTSFLSKF